MNKKIKSNKDKIPKAFLISMVLALLFWSLTKLSGEYTTVVSFPVSYVNLPQDKLIQNVALTALDIQIKSTGFRLISLRFKKRKIKLDARNLINKQGSEYYFLVKDQRATLQNQLSQNYLIASVIQDTIFLDLGLLISKKVPVVDRFNLDFKLGYHLVKKLLFTPDSILVFGPEAQINKLKHLQLEEKTFENISESIDQVIAINQPELLDKINFTTKEVRVVGEVDRFTEGSIDLTFDVVNLPDNITINTFPKTIHIVYQVGLSNFSKINESSFRIICDYAHSSLNNLNYLVPKILSKPSFVTSVKLVPNKIEFLIQK